MRFALLARGSVSGDLAVIGAGPVGCATALAFARNGTKVTLFEASPAAAERFAGEWLHPPAIAALSRLGIEPERLVEGHASHGFVVYPDDGTSLIVLPYAEGTGLSFEHAVLVRRVAFQPHRRGWCCRSKRSTEKLVPQVHLAMDSLARLAGRAWPAKAPR